MCANIRRKWEKSGKSIMQITWNVKLWASSVHNFIFYLLYLLCLNSTEHLYKLFVFAFLFLWYIYICVCVCVCVCVKFGEYKRPQKGEKVLFYFQIPYTLIIVLCAIIDSPIQAGSKQSIDLETLKMEKGNFCLSVKQIKVAESVLNSRWKVDSDNLILLRNVVILYSLKEHLTEYQQRFAKTRPKSSYCLAGKESVYLCVCVCVCVCVYVCVCVHVCVFIEPLA